MDPRRIRALRAMHDEWLARLRDYDPDDEVAQIETDILTGALVGFIPELLDEIERRRAPRTAEPARFLKLDAHGGSA